MKILTNAVTCIMICSFITAITASSSHASLITTETYLSQQVQTSPRDRIFNLLQKEQVIQKLKQQGVSIAEAKERIANLTDSEVLLLNEKIDQLPAGADAAEAILGTALVIFLVLLITDILCVTKVFKFTRCAN